MTNSTHNTVLVLGANGRFGRNAANAFAEAGWTVLSHTRISSKLSDDVAGTHTPFDIENSGQFKMAASQCSVIVNALNPEYPYWTDQLPKITSATITAARTSGATVMIPGNVYNFGTDMPPLLSETTPQQAQTKKGKLRIKLEQDYKAASEDGIQTIILRCGDFLERKKTGGWFDTHLSSKLNKGKFTYPGKRDTDHAWAYLPDAGRAMVELAEIKDSLELFEDIPFEGSTLSACALTSAMSNSLNKDIQTISFPWFAVKFMGLFNPTMREVLEMRYLWDVKHGLDGTKLSNLLPSFRPTPLADIMNDILADQRT